MRNWSLFEELCMLISVHIGMWRRRHVQVGFAEVLLAFDEARERSPSSRFAQECRTIAELKLRDAQGVRRFDA